MADDYLRCITDAAAGDARVAIGTLRAAAQKADRCGLRQLSDEVIREVAPEAKAEIKRRNLEKLTDHQRALYDIIEEDGIAPDALYGTYCRAVEEPKSRRMVRNYLQKMRRYNLVTAHGEGRARQYRTTS